VSSCLRLVAGSASQLRADARHSELDAKVWSHSRSLPPHGGWWWTSMPRCASALMTLCSACGRSTPGSWRQLKLKPKRWTAVGRRAHAAAANATAAAHAGRSSEVGGGGVQSGSAVLLGQLLAVCPSRGWLLRRRGVPGMPHDGAEKACERQQGGRGSTCSSRQGIARGSRGCVDQGLAAHAALHRERGARGVRRAAGPGATFLSSNHGYAVSPVPTGEARGVLRAAGPGAAF
jgi:hypothetical protein